MHLCLCLVRLLKLQGQCPRGSSPLLELVLGRFHSWVFSILVRVHRCHPGTPRSWELQVFSSLLWIETVFQKILKKFSLEHRYTLLHTCEMCLKDTTLEETFFSSLANPFLSLIQSLSFSGPAFLITINVSLLVVSQERVNLFCFLLQP